MTPEAQHVEWKRSWRDEPLRWICGFANAQGGVLEIGKDHGGVVVGVNGVLRLLEEIPAKALWLLGLPPDGVNCHLQDLKAAGVNRRVGSDRSGHREVLR